MASKRLRTRSPGRGRGRRRGCPRAGGLGLGLDALPLDVQLLVLGYLSRHEVATRVRRLSLHWRDVAAVFLNQDLRRLRERYDRAAATLTLREAASVKRPSHAAILNARNAFAVVHDQVRVVHAVTWRYLVAEAGGSRRPLACFYGGRLLDLFWNYLREALACPVQLTAGFFYRGADDQPSEKWRLLSACKKFVNHFEKVTEPRLLEHHADCAAKVLDLLDCLLDAETSLHVLDASMDVLQLRASYHVPGAFFTCLHVSTTTASSWKEQCRYMFMRLRRIVSNSNSNYLQMCRLRSLGRQWRCKASVYSGFGTSAGRLFYYGCLNQPALAGVVQAKVAAEKQEVVFTDVHVELCCPSRLAAPFSLYRRGLWNLRPLRPRKRRCHLKMDVHCPFSHRNRLPGDFSWVLPDNTTTRRRARL